MKVICVDDEPLAVEYTLSQCARLNEINEARGFTDARQALDWLRGHPADAALLDINMPEIDGITLAARIKELHPQTAILFLTAYREYAFDLYDRKQQKQFDVYIRSLRETLCEYGIPEIMEMEKGILRVRPDTFLCDVYLFYSGDSNAINAYRGEYMSSYSWANMTEAILYWKTTNR